MGPEIKTDQKNQSFLKCSLSLLTPTDTPMKAVMAQNTKDSMRMRAAFLRDQIIDLETRLTSVREELRQTTETLHQEDMVGKDVNGSETDRVEVESQASESEPKRLRVTDA